MAESSDHLPMRCRLCAQDSLLAGGRESEWVVPCSAKQGGQWKLLAIDGRRYETEPGHQISALASALPTRRACLGLRLGTQPISAATGRQGNLNLLLPRIRT